MTDVKKQQICIKFCFKLCKTVFETQRMLTEAFDDKALGQTQTYECFKHLKNGWMSVNDDKRSGQPLTGTTTENLAKMQEAILDNQRQMIHDVCNTVRLSYGMCQQILSDDLNIGRNASKFVPRLLSSDQKEYRIAVYWA